MYETPGETRMFESYKDSDGVLVVANDSDLQNACWSCPYERVLMSSSPCSTMENEAQILI